MNSGGGLSVPIEKPSRDTPSAKSAQRAEGQGGQSSDEQAIGKVIEGHPSADETDHGYQGDHSEVYEEHGPQELKGRVKCKSILHQTHPA
jgi:hypothetical protein